MSRRMRQLFLLIVFTCCNVLLFGQGSDMASILRPPAGAKVALIVFEDLQCPDCARAAPVEAQAREKYKIPVVRYNYPLPQHNWSTDAAILAEYFETKSPE